MQIDGQKGPVHQHLQWEGGTKIREEKKMKKKREREKLGPVSTTTANRFHARRGPRGTNKRGDDVRKSSAVDEHVVASTEPLFFRVTMGGVEATAISQSPVFLGYFLGPFPHKTNRQVPSQGLVYKGREGMPGARAREDDRRLRQRPCSLTGNCFL